MSVEFLVERRHERAPERDEHGGRTLTLTAQVAHLPGCSSIPTPRRATDHDPVGVDVVATTTQTVAAILASAANATTLAPLHPCTSCIAPGAPA